MKFYVVIDTNVIVSAALKPESIPGQILELVFSGLIIPVLCEKIEEEYYEVLSRPKFSFDNQLVKEILENIKTLGLHVDPKHLDMNLPDMQDLVFYETLIEIRNKEDAYLVTGNMKHFPKSDFIVNPREMIDVIYYSNN